MPTRAIIKATGVLDNVEFYGERITIETISEKQHGVVLLPHKVKIMVGDEDISNRVAKCNIELKHRHVPTITLEVLEL